MKVLADRWAEPQSLEGMLERAESGFDFGSAGSSASSSSPRSKAAALRGLQKAVQILAAMEEDLLARRSTGAFANQAATCRASGWLLPDDYPHLLGPLWSHRLASVRKERRSPCSAPPAPSRNQAAIDQGSWGLSQEILLEQHGPHFSAFQKRARADGSSLERERCLRRDTQEAGKALREQGRTRWIFGGGKRGEHREEPAQASERRRKEWGKERKRGLRTPAQSCGGAPACASSFCNPLFLYSRLWRPFHNQPPEPPSLVPAMFEATGVSAHGLVPSQEPVCSPRPPWPAKPPPRTGGQSPFNLEPTVTGGPTILCDSAQARPSFAVAKAELPTRICEAACAPRQTLCLDQALDLATSRYQRPSVASFPCSVERTQEVEVTCPKSLVPSSGLGLASAESAAASPHATTRGSPGCMATLPSSLFERPLQTSSSLHVHADSCPLLDEEKHPIQTSCPKVPGAAATPVDPAGVWLSVLECLSKCDGHLWHFLRCTTSASERRPSSRRFWPLPQCGPGAPGYSGLPALLEASPSEQAVFLMAGTLSWLHAGSPTCDARTKPSSLRLQGERGTECPSKLNQSSVVELRLKVWERLSKRADLWNSDGLIDAETMGRTASKVEGIEAILAGLESEFELTAELDATEEVAPLSTKQEDAPLLGTSAARAVIAAKDIELSRLKFGPEPKFDPRPYLDPLTRSVYERPLQHASLQHPPPDELLRVRVRVAGGNKLSLLERLDEVGRLSLVPSRAAPTGYGAGAFAVPKSLSNDRFIMDSRPMNSAETPVNHWLPTLCSAAALTGLVLKDDEIILMSGEDIRDYFYAFEISDERLRRNIFKMHVRPEEVAHLRCFEARMRDEPLLTPALNTMAMGDCQAVSIGQTAHLGVILQSKALGFPLPQENPHYL